MRGVSSPQTATDVMAKQSLGSGHFCGVSIVIVVVVVLLFWFSCRDLPDKGSVSHFGR